MEPTQALRAQLRAHNARVRKWAACMPRKYRRSALALAYPANVDSCSHSYSFRSMERMALTRDGGKDHVSYKTLERDLPAFEATGAIRVEHHPRQTNVYHIDFGKTITKEDAELGKRQRRRDRDWETSAVEEFLAESAPAEPVAPEAKPIEDPWGYVPPVAPVGKPLQKTSHFEPEAVSCNAVDSVMDIARIASERNARVAAKRAQKAATDADY